MVLLVFLRDEVDFPLKVFLTLCNIAQYAIQSKDKDTALDFTVCTGGADLRFLALQPGSAMGGWGPAILCFRTPFLFTFPRFLQVPI